MRGGVSILRLPSTCRWLMCLLLWSLFELCHCQDAFTPNSGGTSNSAINDDISLALIIVAVVLLATFLCVCCAACRNSLCPDEQTDSDAATDSPDTPNLLSCDIEVNDMIPPTYSNLVADGIIGEEENAEQQRSQENSTVVRMDPITPPPTYDVLFKPSWPRSASAYVLHPERIEEVAMADLYTRQTSRTSERTVLSENSINRSVSFADTTPDANEGSNRNVADSMHTSPDISGGTIDVTSDGSLSRTDDTSHGDIVQSPVSSPRSVSESERSDSRQESDYSQVQSPVSPAIESNDRTPDIHVNEEENNNET